MRSGLVVMFALFVGCGDDQPDSVCRAVPEGAIAFCSDAPKPVDAAPPCNPLTQEGCATGEKCTWLLDAVAPDSVGHLGCVPDGTATVGEACMFGDAGTTGFDNCTAGAVCSTDRGTGTCTMLCDLGGGDPQCGIVATCTAHPRIFVTQGMSPTVGLCEML